MIKYNPGNKRPWEVWHTSYFEETGEVKVLMSRHKSLGRASIAFKAYLRTRQVFRV